jgi:hypothetical protein
VGGTKIVAEGVREIGKFTFLHTTGRPKDPNQTRACSSVKEM